jgi:integrase
MNALSALDAAGRRRSPATMPGYHGGRPPRNKGMCYPADPPTVEQIVAVMRHTADDRHGWRVRALSVVLWRAGLRIQEALALTEHDLDYRRGSILVGNGKGGRRREVGIDQWGREQLRPWLAARAELPVGPLFASSMARPAAASGRAPRFAASSARRPRARESGAASRRTSCGTRTPRAGPGGRAAQHHPAPVGARESRHDVDPSARDRSRGDHRDREHTTSADDVGKRRAAAPNDSRGAGVQPATPAPP